METKICKKCGKEKPLDDFYINYIYKDCHMPVCKECQVERTMTKYYERKEAFENVTENNRADN